MKDPKRNEQKPRRKMIEAQDQSRERSEASRPASSSSGIEGQEQPRKRSGLNVFLTKLQKGPGNRQKSKIRRRYRRKLIALHPIEENWERVEEGLTMIESMEENTDVFPDGPETLWLSFQHSQDKTHLENAKEVISKCKIVKGARGYLELASKTTSTPEMIEYFKMARECLDKAAGSGYSILIEIRYLKDLYIQVFKKINDLSDNAVKVTLSNNKLEMTKSNNKLVRDTGSKDCEAASKMIAMSNNVVKMQLSTNELEMTKSNNELVRETGSKDSESARNMLAMSAHKMKVQLSTNDLDKTKSNNELVRDTGSKDCETARNMIAMRKIVDPRQIVEPPQLSTPSSFHARSVDATPPNRSVESIRTPGAPTNKARLRTPVHNDRFNIRLNLYNDLAFGIGFPKAIQKLLEVDVLGLGYVGDGKLRFQGLYDCIEAIETHYEIPERLKDLLDVIRRNGNDLRHEEPNLLANPSGHWYKIKEILDILYPGASIVHDPSSKEVRLEQQVRKLEQEKQELEQRNQELERLLADARSSGGHYERRNSDEYHRSYSPRRDHHDGSDRKRYRDYDYRSPSPSHKRSRHHS